MLQCCLPCLSFHLVLVLFIASCNLLLHDVQHLVDYGIKGTSLYVMLEQSSTMVLRCKACPLGNGKHMQMQTLAVSQYCCLQSTQAAE